MVERNMEKDRYNILDNFLHLFFHTRNEFTKQVIL